MGPILGGGKVVGYIYTFGALGSKGLEEEVGRIVSLGEWIGFSLTGKKSGGWTLRSVVGYPCVRSKEGALA